MATTPQSNVTVSAEAGATAGGTGYCTVIAPVPLNADGVPRIYAGWKAIYDFHGYAPGVDYSAHHVNDTRKGVLFCGIPIATPGVVGRQDSSGVTGTCVITAVAGANGTLDETKARVRCTKAGTIGTDDIRLAVSFDDGVTEKAVRLGTATSYVVPYLGITLNFAAGTLAVDDEFTFTTTAPKWDSDGIALARTKLEAQQKVSRSWMVIGDLLDDTEATVITNATNGYETSKKRFTIARASVRDRLPLAQKSVVTKRMTGAPTITFAEVGGTGDTITRSAGSFISDGFAVGDWITVAGSTSNNVSGPIASLTATVITLGTTDLAAEGPVSGVSIVATETLTFAEVGGTGDTITRSSGSWLDDGFRAGDTVTIAGTASNNVTGALAAVTATVLTFDTTDLTAEVIGSSSVTIVKGETMNAWVAAMDAEFAPIADEKRISLGLGRARKASPITGWELRRPAQWPTSIREYQHDIHRPTWTKEDGVLDGWKLTDANGVKSEFDQDVDGGGLEGGFTCLRTWPNGPEGTFVAMDLTRADENTALAFVHNMNVANVFCSVVQKAGEDIIGKTPQVNDDGTGTSAALEQLQEGVNADVRQALLREFKSGEGQRASKAVWNVDPTSVLKGVNATLKGNGNLVVNGTIVDVDTLVKVS